MWFLTQAVAIISITATMDAWDLDIDARLVLPSPCKAEPANGLRKQAVMDANEDKIKPKIKRSQTLMLVHSTLFRFSLLF